MFFFKRPVHIRINRNVQEALQLAAELPNDPNVRAELFEAILESFASQARFRAVGYRARTVLKALRSGSRGGGQRSRGRRRGQSR